MSCASLVDLAPRSLQASIVIADVVLQAQVKYGVDEASVVASQQHYKDDDEIRAETARVRSIFFGNADIPHVDDVEVPEGMTADEASTRSCRQSCAHTGMHANAGLL